MSVGKHSSHIRALEYFPTTSKYKTATKNTTKAPLMFIKSLACDGLAIRTKLVVNITMYIKSVLALCPPTLASKKKYRLHFDSQSNTVSCSEGSKAALDSDQRCDSGRNYSLDKVLETGQDTYSEFHQQLFSKTSLKNLNIFVVGNNDELKQKCLSSEGKHYSVVKELIKKVLSLSKRLYLSIESGSTLTQKQIISSYSQFLVCFGKAKNTKKQTRLCFQYCIDDTVYTTNVVSLPDNLKETSEVYRLKQTNRLVTKLCSKEKNNVFYLCLDRNNEESEQYLMITSTNRSKILTPTTNSNSQMRTRNKSSSSVSTKKTQSDSLRKQNISKEQIRAKVTEKMLVDKNRKLDQLNRLLSTRDTEVQEFKTRVKRLEQRVQDLEEEKATLTREKSNIPGKYQYLVQQLESQRQVYYAESNQRYHQYEDRIQELKIQVEQIRKIDKITMEKFQQLTKEKICDFNRQIQELREANKTTTETNIVYQRDLNALAQKCEILGQENSQMKQQLKFKHNESNRNHEKYYQLQNRLKSIIGGEMP